MQTSFISTRSMQTAPRLAIAGLQADLARANREVATGRLADPGLALGARVSRGVEVRIEETVTDRLIRSNGLADARLDQTQRVLADLRSRANAVLESVTALPPSSSAVTVLIAEAGDALAELVARLNGSDGTNFLFGGITSGVAPVADYDGAPRLAVEAAMTAAFGAVPIPPGTTPAQMDAFLSGDFAAVFDPAGWSAAWSVASDVPLDTEIERGRIVATSVSANEAPFRELAMAYTMLAGLGMDGLRSDTRQVIVDRALAALGSAIAGVIAIEADVGLVQQSIERASGRLRDERSLLAITLDRLEGRDPVEAKAEIDLITLQLEMSYALTLRVNQLTILNFA